MFTKCVPLLLCISMFGGCKQSERQTSEAVSPENQSNLNLVDAENMTEPQLNASKANICNSEVLQVDIPSSDPNTDYFELLICDAANATQCVPDKALQTANPTFQYPNLSSATNILVKARSCGRPYNVQNPDKLCSSKWSEASVSVPPASAGTVRDALISKADIEAELVRECTDMRKAIQTFLDTKPTLSDDTRNLLTSHLEAGVDMCAVLIADGSLNAMIDKMKAEQVRASGSTSTGSTRQLGPGQIAGIAVMGVLSLGFFVATLAITTVGARKHMAYKKTLLKTGVDIRALESDDLVTLKQSLERQLNPVEKEKSLRNKFEIPTGISKTANFDFHVPGLRSYGLNEQEIADLMNSKNAGGRNNWTKTEITEMKKRDNKTKYSMKIEDVLATPRTSMIENTNDKIARKVETIKTSKEMEAKTQKQKGRMKAASIAGGAISAVASAGFAAGAAMLGTLGLADSAQSEFMDSASKISQKILDGKARLDSAVLSLGTCP